jgi:protein TonB
VFQTLLESSPERGGHRPRWGTGVALLLHGAVVSALLRSPAPARAVPSLIVPRLVFPSVPVRVPPTMSRGVVPPIVDPPPLRLPPVVLPEIPGMPTRGGPAVATASAIVAAPAGEAGNPVAAALVQEAPVLLSAPPPLYPRELRNAGVEGTVVLRLVVDTLGRAEPGTIETVRSDHPALVGPAARSLRLARFRPARMFGRAVRVLVEVPVRFRLRR